MKRLLIILSILLIATVFILVIPDISFTQPPPPPSKPAQTPIDGGLGLLAAVGGAYAIKKLKKNKKT